MENRTFRTTRAAMVKSATDANQPKGKGHLLVVRVVNDEIVLERVPDAVAIEQNLWRIANMKQDPDDPEQVTVYAFRD
jgi:hypothetical protein